MLPSTRLVAALVAPILAAAGVLLYAFPGETTRLWAWPMDPPMTGLAVGGGYLAGAVLFARAARARQWHAIAVVFLAATVLSSLLLVATVLHWDRFTHEHVSFWAWLALYAITPWLLPTLWVRNNRHDPRVGTPADTVPKVVRAAGGAVGAGLLASALAIFLHPPLVVSSWPWALTPLTARTLAAFLAFVGTLLAVSWFEQRWSALRLHVESATLGLALVGLGAMRARTDLDGPGWAVAAFTVLLTVLVGGLLAVMLVMRRGVPPEPAQPS